MKASSTGNGPARLTPLAVVRGGAEQAAAAALANPMEFQGSGRIVDLVREQARRRPGHAAVIEGAAILSYQGLVARIDEVRELLRSAGCGARQVIACAGPRSAATAVLFLALEDLGAVYFPVDPAWPRARVADVLSRGGCTHLANYTKGIERLEITTMDGGPQTPPFEDVPPAYLIFTSGTTGLPKGAIVEHRGMRNHLWAKITDLGITSADRVAFTAPLVFTIAIWQMLAPLMAGATTVVVGEADVTFPPRLPRLLLQQRVSVVELVPTAIGLLLDQLLRRPPEDALPELRWLISTGEELTPGLAGRVLRSLPHVSVLNAYGSTECSDDVTHHVVTMADTTLPRLPVGSPIANAVIYVLVHEEGPDAWRAARPGESGEIFVGGIPVGVGYPGDATATGKAFHQDPIDPHSPTGRLYRTGDLGRVDQGRLHYLGRSDRQVKVAGMRLELDEIEAVLSRHPELDHCAASCHRPTAPSRDWLPMSSPVPQSPRRSWRTSSRRPFRRLRCPNGSGGWSRSRCPPTARWTTAHSPIRHGQTDLRGASDCSR
ncbi:AMP-binding protein [Streptomyces sp. NPDC005402]|uniref:AMP-binding protein n=1 Tax=Streptomyces sp. NPDC005402 TaxID=3155338 RepID=UPI0033AB8E85